MAKDETTHYFEMLSNEAVINSKQVTENGKFFARLTEHGYSRDKRNYDYQMYFNNIYHVKQKHKDTRQAPGGFL